MGIQLKIMKLNGMIDRINERIEELKNGLEEGSIATEIEILNQHKDRLIAEINNLRAEIGVC